MKNETLETLIGRFGKKYSEILGIELSYGKDREIFKWFLVSILFGAPITETSVVKTYKCFEKCIVLSPKQIIETGWNRLVEILDEGSYTRYDFKTADKLLEVMKNLMGTYNGSLTCLHDSACDGLDLEKRLKDLGKGLGDVTISIFLRELRDIWEKANPSPTSLVNVAAENLGIINKRIPADALRQLKDFWSKKRIAGKTFVNFETALLRLGKDFCRKRKCAICSVKCECLNPKVP